MGTGLIHRRTLAGTISALLIAAAAMALSAPAMADSSATDAGTSHTCTIAEDGSLACWGDDSRGQLDGIPSGSFSSVSAGGAHSCAIRDDGTLACWGDDSQGQLDGIPSGSFSSVSAGGAHSCAVALDGSLACWGDDSQGQVSGSADAHRLHKHKNDRHHPHPKDEPPDFVAVAAGATHSCAIADDGDIVCWGDNSQGQRDGSPEGEFTSVSAGGAHSCAVAADGSLACWGDDSQGQLDGIPSGSFSSVSAGGAHSCAIAEDGSFACWGDNDLGQVTPLLTNTEPPRALVGEAYEHRFATTPQVPAAAFLLSGGLLPAGLGLGAEGLLSGTPTEAGDFVFGVTAANGITPADEAEVTLEVVGSPELEIEAATEVTTDSAALSGSVNPANLAADAWFEYWPSAASPATAQRTPEQAVAEGIAPVEIGAALSGLSPDTDYSFRLAAVNELSAEPAVSPTLTLKTAAPPPDFVPKPPVQLADPGLGPPTAGETINVTPANGVVRKKCPGERGFVSLATETQLSISCLIDVRRGTVDLTTANDEAATQSAYFWGGVFFVSQSAARDWAADLKLVGPRRCEKRSSKRASTSARRGKGRKLWGSGKGNFRTAGNYGSASVRGTIWLVADRCDNSTLFAVREGTVLVRDFVRRKSVVLQAGQRYVAKAAIPRLR
jgi:hypothetical protein